MRIGQRTVKTAIETVARIYKDEDLYFNKGGGLEASLRLQAKISRVMMTDGWNEMERKNEWDCSKYSYRRQMRRKSKSKRKSKMKMKTKKMMMRR